jgi:hypothetical protein
LRIAKYKGDWSYGKKRVVRREGDRVVRRRAADDEVIRTHRPELTIIAADDWDRVQSLIAERKREMPNRQAPATHMLSQILRCDGCGGPMHVRICDGRRTDWKKRYYCCTEKRRAGRCSSTGKYLPADLVEGQIVEYVRATVLGQIETRIRESIREEVRRVSEVSEARATEAEKVRTQLQELKAERVRLVRMASATDAPEVVDALCINQERARALEGAMVIASRPALDEACGARLEAAAMAQVDRMRQQLDGGESRAACVALFPQGLRFKIGNGLWLIEGSASVPTYRNTSEYRLPLRQSVRSVVPAQPAWRALASTNLSSPLGPTRMTPRSSSPSFSASPTFHEIVVAGPGGPTTGTPSMRPRCPTIATRWRATNRPFEIGKRGSSASAPKSDVTCSAESRTKRGEWGLRITYSQ